MSNRAGFTIIEVLLAIVIAGILAGLLYGAWWQLSRSSRGLSGNMDIDWRMTLLSHQLEKDISGACIPLQELKKQVQQDKNEEKKDGEQEKISKQQQESDATEDKVLSHIFYSSNKNDQLELLTCITNNTSVVYWGERVGRAVPKIGRVVYRIKPEERDDIDVVTYALYRQESSDLDYALFDKKDGKSAIRAYKVIDGIKNIKVRYIAVLDHANGNGEKEQEIKEYDDWNVEAHKKEDKRRLIPHMVIVTVVLWRNDWRSDASFSLSIPIVPDFTFTHIVEGDKEKNDKKTEKKPKEAVRIAVRS